jgi:hypothetical protein
MTRLLQVGLSAYFVVFVLIGWVLLISPISAGLATGNQSRAEVLIASWSLWTMLVALMTYGSFMKWRWAFWGYLLLLVGLIAASIRGPNTSTVALIWDLGTGITALALLTVSIVGLFRFGPWALKKASATR